MTIIPISAIILVGAFVLLALTVAVMVRRRSGGNRPAGAPAAADAGRAAGATDQGVRLAFVIRRESEKASVAAGRQIVRAIGGWVMALIAVPVLALVVAIVLPSVVRYRTAVPTQMEVTAGQYAPAIVEQTSGQSKVSASEADWGKADHWPASVYSSVESAASSLTNRLYEKLIECGQPAGAKVLLTMVEQSPRRAGERQALPGLVPIQEWLNRHEWRDVSIQFATDSTRVPPAGSPPPTGSIGVFVTHRVEGKGEGVFEATVHHPALPAPQEFTTRYVAKPWVREEAPALYRGNSLYVIGRSGLEPTEEEALRVATLDAVGRVVELAKGELRTRNLSPADRAGAEGRVSEAAQTFVNDHRSDQFCQQLQTSHVAVHRAALRVAAADSDLENLVDKVLGRVRTAQASVGRQALAGGVMGVFILLAYLFLNAETKGHFAWKLRGICASLFAAICWAIHHFGIFA